MFLFSKELHEKKFKITYNSCYAEEDYCKIPRKTHLLEEFQLRSSEKRKFVVEINC